jgi:hypothetical protein
MPPVTFVVAIERERDKMEQEFKKLDERLRRLEQRSQPPRYPSLDQINDLLGAMRIYRNVYASTAGYHDKVKELIKHLPREGRQEILYLAKLAQEAEDQKPSPKL